MYVCMYVCMFVCMYVCMYICNVCMMYVSMYLIMYACVTLQSFSSPVRITFLALLPVKPNVSRVTSFRIALIEMKQLMLQFTASMNAGNNPCLNLACRCGCRCWQHSAALVVASRFSATKFSLVTRQTSTVSSNLAPILEIRQYHFAKR